jgi:hypothetical protein
MLHDFLDDNRQALIDRCRLKVASRVSPIATDHVLGYGIPVFIDQLIKTLRLEQTDLPLTAARYRAPPAAATPRPPRSARAPCATAAS